MAGWSRSADVLEDHRGPLPLGQRGDPGPQSSSDRSASGRRDPRPPGRRAGRPRPRPAPARRPRDAVHVHGAPGVIVSSQPRRFARRAQRGVGRERLGPRLLGHVVAVHRPGQGVREPGDVAPVRVDEELEGRQGHDIERRAPVGVSAGPVHGCHYARMTPSPAPPRPAAARQGPAAPACGWWSWPASGPAPFAAMMLADLGADVVRVDRPRRAPAAATARTRTSCCNRGRARSPSTSSTRRPAGRARPGRRRRRADRGLPARRRPSGSASARTTATRSTRRWSTAG